MAPSSQLLSSRRGVVSGSGGAAAFSRPRLHVAAAARVALTRAVLFPLPRTSEQQKTVDRLEAVLPYTPLPGAPTRRPLMAGNWKMNPNTLEEAEVSEAAFSLCVTMSERPLRRLATRILFWPIMPIKTFLSSD